jgi:hypothetical protein
MSDGVSGVKNAANAAEYWVRCKKFGIRKHPMFASDENAMPTLSIQWRKA